MRCCQLCYWTWTLHRKINISVSRWTDDCHIPGQHPATFERDTFKTIRSLAVLTHHTGWVFDNWKSCSCKVSSIDHSTCDVWKISQEPVWKRGCADHMRQPVHHNGRDEVPVPVPVRGRACAALMQWWGTQTSISRLKVTATLTVSSSSVRLHNVTGRANSKSPLWLAVAAKKVACWKGLSRQDYT